MRVELLDKDIDKYLENECRERADNIVLDILNGREIRLTFFKEGHYQGEVLVDIKEDKVYDNYTLLEV